MELLLVNSNQAEVLNSQGTVVAELSDGQFEAKQDDVIRSLLPLHWRRTIRLPT